MEARLCPIFGRRVGATHPYHSSRTSTEIIATAVVLQKNAMSAARFILVYAALTDRVTVAAKPHLVPLRALPLQDPQASESRAVQS